MQYARSLAAAGHHDQAHAVAAQRADLVGQGAVFYLRETGSPLTMTQALAD